MENSLPIKVSLYDDNPDFRCSLSRLFGLMAEFDLLGAYPDARQIIENCTYRKPDVILMDIDMPFITGIEAITILHSEFPEIKVLMLTVFDDNLHIFEAICKGAVGYILKNSDPHQILDATKEAYQGGVPMTNSIALKVLGMFRENAPQKLSKSDLTDKEQTILVLLTKGYSYKMVANECEISIDTVRFHIKKIYEKLHVHSMTEAVSKALKNKWV